VQVAVRILPSRRLWSFASIQQILDTEFFTSPRWLKDMPLVMGCIVLESRREPIDLLAIDYTCLVAFLLDFLQLDTTV